MSAATARLHAQPIAQADQSDWKNLYRIAAIAALITVVFIPIQIVVYIVWTPPAAVLEFFNLFQANWLRGLLDLDLLLVVDSVLAVPIILALYLALRRANPSVMLLATTLALVSLAAYFSSNPAFQMLSLSNQYAAATTEAQRTALLGAGQAMLAGYTGTAFQVNYVLGAAALAVMSAVMLRGDVFGRATGYLGLAANGLALLLYVPVIGVWLSIGSVVILLVWYVMLARRLWQLR